jgi:TolA-binding protein
MMGGARCVSGSLTSAHQAVSRIARLRGCATAIVAALVVFSFQISPALGASTGDQAEEFLWGITKNSNTEALFKIYLQQYPNGPHSAEAEERIKELSAPSAQAAQEQSLAQPPPMPAPAPPPKAPPQLSPAPPPTPEQQAKRIQATFYAKAKAVLREAPASDAKIRGRLYVREVLKVDLQSDDGQWYHVGGAHGGWVDAAHTMDAKMAEAEAWTQADHSSGVEGLKAYLKAFPKGAHANEAREKLDAAEAEAEAPPGASQDHQAEEPSVTPEEREALNDLTRKWREEPAPEAPRQITPPGDNGGGMPPHPDAPTPSPESNGTTQEAPREPDQRSQLPTPTLPYGSAMEQYDAALGMLIHGQFKDGEERLESIIRQFPSDPIIANVRYSLGDSYFNQQDYEHALIQLQLALSLKPSSPTAPLAHLQIAVSKGYRGEQKEACAELQSLGSKYRGAVLDWEQRISEWQRNLQCGR